MTAPRSPTLPRVTEGIAMNPIAKNPKVEPCPCPQPWTSWMLMSLVENRVHQNALAST